MKEFGAERLCMSSVLGSLSLQLLHDSDTRSPLQLQRIHLGILLVDQLRFLRVCSVIIHWSPVCGPVWGNKTRWSRRISSFLLLLLLLPPPLPQLVMLMLQEDPEQSPGPGSSGDAGESDPTPHVCELRVSEQTGMKRCGAERKRMRRKKRRREWGSTCRFLLSLSPFLERF